MEKASRKRTSVESDDEMDTRKKSKSSAGPKTAQRRIIESDDEVEVKMETDVREEADAVPKKSVKIASVPKPEVKDPSRPKTAKKAKFSSSKPYKEPELFMDAKMPTRKTVADASLKKVTPLIKDQKLPTAEKTAAGSQGQLGAADPKAEVSRAEKTVVPVAPKPLPIAESRGQLGVVDLKAEVSRAEKTAAPIAPKPEDAKGPTAAQMPKDQKLVRPTARKTITPAALPSSSAPKKTEPAVQLPSTSKAAKWLSNEPQHYYPTAEHVYEFEAFAVSMDHVRNIARWTFERLTPQQRIGQPKFDRPGVTTYYAYSPAYSKFSATRNDFECPEGFEMGHLVPVANHSYSKSAMKETFCLYNIVIQFGRLNHGKWRELEGVLSAWTQRFEEVNIVNVPLFVPNENGEVVAKVVNGVYVPTHLAKVVYRAGGKGPHELWSWMMPNEAPDKSKKLSDYLCKLSLIEGHARFELFPDVRDNELKVNGVVGAVSSGVPEEEKKNPTGPPLHPVWKEFERETRGWGKSSAGKCNKCGKSISCKPSDDVVEHCLTHLKTCNPNAYEQIIAEVELRKVDNSATRIREINELLEGCTTGGEKRARLKALKYQSVWRLAMRKDGNTNRCLVPGCTCTRAAGVNSTDTVRRNTQAHHPALHSYLMALWDEVGNLQKNDVSG